jgi:hypothetical protein
VLKTATSDQVQKILVRALSPYVGPTMAGASVRGLVERLGFGGSLARSQVEHIVDALAPGLHVYVGKQKAQAVVREVWIALDALGGDP